MPKRKPCWLGGSFCPPKQCLWHACKVRWVFLTICIDFKIICDCMQLERRWVWDKLQISQLWPRLDHILLNIWGEKSQWILRHFKVFEGSVFQGSPRADWASSGVQKWKKKSKIFVCVHRQCQRCQKAFFLWNWLVFPEICDFMFAQLEKNLPVPVLNFFRVFKGF